MRVAAAARRTASTLQRCIRKARGGRAVRAVLPQTAGCASAWTAARCARGCGVREREGSHPERTCRAACTHRLERVATPCHNTYSVGRGAKAGDSERAANNTRAEGTNSTSDVALATPPLLPNALHLWVKATSVVRRVGTPAPARHALLREVLRTRVLCEAWERGLAAETASAAAVPAVAAAAAVISLLAATAGRSGYGRPHLSRRCPLCRLLRRRQSCLQQPTQWRCVLATGG